MQREHWGGRLAFVLAAAGSAVGLGNVWKFPYITGVHGGAAFILVYLVCIALVGMPIMIAELVIGRTSQKSPIAAFRDLAPRAYWWVVGAMGVMAGYVILSFYSVVAGWTMQYLTYAVQGDFTGLGSDAAIMRLKDEYVRDAATKRLEGHMKTNGVDEAAAHQELGGVEEIEAQISASATKQDVRAYAIGKGFGRYIGSKTQPLMWHLIFMVITMLVVSAGVGGGIERASKILMPVLLLILIGLAVRGVTLDGGMQGVRFLVEPDFSKLTPESVLEALGHAFFTLSLGMGAMLTYGSYLDEDTNLYVSGLWVVVADTLIALIAGLAIYPALFSYGLDPGAGPGLIFVTMPVIFTQMPYGYGLAALFFGALLVAALTSAISLLEVCVAHFVDEWEWPRSRATMIAGVTITLLGIPSAVMWAPGFLPWSFFDCMDKLATNILLPVGGMMTALFVGWGWKKEAVLEALGHGDEGLTATFGDPWVVLCRYVSPLLVLLVILNSFGLLGLH